MDPFYIDTVTIYNKTFGDDPLLGDDVWYPTVIENVRLLVTKGANVDKNGNTSADTARLHIMTDNPVKPYLEPIAWQKSEDKTTAFTMTPGEDFFVSGDTTAEDTTQDDFFSYMQQKYDRCFAVTNVDAYTLIPHMEVGGR